MKLPKKFLAQTLLILLFLAGATASILFAKAMVTAYMLQIQSYSTAVSQLSATASTPEGIVQLQGILEAIKPILQKIKLLTYAALPATLFLFWTMLVGTSFYITARKTRIPFWKYALNFAAISAIPFAASIYLLLRILQTSSTALITGEGIWTIIIYATLMTAIWYITVISYALIGMHSLLKIPLKTLLLSAKKIYALLPVFLLLTITAIAAALLTFSTYLKISHSAGIPIAYNLAELLIAISLAALLKNLMIKLALKHSRAL